MQQKQNNFFTSHGAHTLCVLRYSFNTEYLTTPKILLTSFAFFFFYFFTFLFFCNWFHEFLCGFSNFLYTLVWVAPECLHLAHIEINLFFIDLLTYWHRWFIVLYTIIFCKRKLCSETASLFKTCIAHNGNISKALHSVCFFPTMQNLIQIWDPLFCYQMFFRNANVLSKSIVTKPSLDLDLDLHSRQA